MNSSKPQPLAAAVSNVSGSFLCIRNNCKKVVAFLDADRTAWISTSLTAASTTVKREYKYATQAAQDQLAPPEERSR
jgi:hypothetical protein